MVRLRPRSGLAPRPEPVRESIPLNATLPAVPAERVPEVLARYDGTIRELKIKVAEKGQSLADDVARVAAAREALPEARLKIDANMGYTPPALSRRSANSASTASSTPSSPWQPSRTWRRSVTPWPRRDCRSASPPTSRFARPKIRCAWPAPMPPTSSSSRPLPWAVFAVP